MLRRRFSHFSSSCLLAAASPSSVSRRHAGNSHPPGADFVVMDQEPEFEGEEPIATEGAAPIEENKRYTFAIPEGFQPPPRTIPAEIGVFRRFTAHDNHEIKLVRDAYGNYYNHIRFRNGWEEPTFSKEMTETVFHQAATYVVRIRNVLDDKNPGQKLRVRDGAAQMFLHSDAGKRLADDQEALTRELIHQTLHDAMGYVEGLSRPRVDQFIDHIHLYLHNPKVHMLHTLAEIQSMIQEVPMADEVPEALEEVEKDPKAVRRRHQDFYAEKGTPEDLAWRKAIEAIYGAAEKCGEIESA